MAKKRKSRKINPRKLNFKRLAICAALLAVAALTAFDIYLRLAWGIEPGYYEQVLISAGIPLTIVWLGIGLPAKSFIVFFAAFVPCLINAYTGIRQTKAVLINVGKTFGATNFTIFWKVCIPSSMTMTFAGVKVAIGNAWATLVAAEMLASSSGLGYMILMGRSYGRVDLVILGIVVIGLLGVVISALINSAENLVLGWKKL